MWIGRTSALAFLFLFTTVESRATEEASTLLLECKGSVTDYKNGVLQWSGGGPIYYRIKLHSSYAVVQFRMDNDNYRFADRFDLKPYDSSYELALPSNTSRLSQNIEIDRLSGNFTARIIDNDIEDKYSGYCYKIDGASKF